PDAVVGPVGEVVVRIALQIHALHRDRAGADQRETAWMVSIDQLLGRARRLHQHAQPAERIAALVFGVHGRRQRRSGDAVIAVATGDEIALELDRLAVITEADGWR